eukprot:3127311-Rhodomonas_salina.2
MCPGGVAGADTEGVLSGDNHPHVADADKVGVAWRVLEGGMRGADRGGMAEARKLKVRPAHAFGQHMRVPSTCTCVCPAHACGQA